MFPPECQLLKRFLWVAIIFSPLIMCIFYGRYCVANRLWTSGIKAFSRPALWGCVHQPWCTAPAKYPKTTCSPWPQRRPNTPMCWWLPRFWHGGLLVDWWTITPTECVTWSSNLVSTNKKNHFMIITDHVDMPFPFKNRDALPTPSATSATSVLTLWPSGRKPRSETTVPRSPVLSQRCGRWQTHGRLTCAMIKSWIRFMQSFGAHTMTTLW